MNLPLLFNVLHAEASREAAEARADYRVPLLTRRTLAQSAEELVHAREHAPSAIRVSSLYGRVPHRPV